MPPSPESGPAPATCLLGCARRAISLPDSTRVTLCDRGRPPIPLIECLPLSPCAVPDGHRPGEDGRRSLGTLLRNTREQCTNLSLPVAPVSPQRADRGQFSGLRPSCDGLGVDAKHRGDLRGRQQRLGLWCTCGHVCGLSSWTSVAIPVLLVRPSAPWGACRGCPIWPTETILPSPAVTRRPPGAKLPGCPVTPPITVTQGESSDTNRRIAADSEILSGKYSPAGPGPLSSPARIPRTRATGYAREDTRRKSSLSYRDIPERHKVGRKVTRLSRTVSYQPVRSNSALPATLRASSGTGPRARARNTLGSDPGSTRSRDGTKESPP